MTKLERVAAALVRPEFPGGVAVLTPDQLPGGRLPPQTWGLAGPSLQLAAGRPPDRPAVALDLRQIGAAYAGRRRRWWRRAWVRGVLVHELAHLLTYTVTLGPRWWTRPDRPDPGFARLAFEIAAAGPPVAGPAVARAWEQEVDGHDHRFIRAVLTLLARADRLDLPVSRWVAGPTSFHTASLTGFYRPALGAFDPARPFWETAATSPPDEFLRVWADDRAAALDALAATDTGAA